MNILGLISQLIGIKTLRLTKTLRTDCGGEYTNNEFRNFCFTSDILHQFTCPHTSQQNGVAERKHCHIVDMALTLISQSSLPLQYWSYAFSTAVFLINRLPSLHHHSTSPWESLFSKQPNYSLFNLFSLNNQITLFSKNLVVLVFHYYILFLDTSLTFTLKNVSFLVMHPTPKVIFV